MSETRSLWRWLAPPNWVRDHLCSAAHRSLYLHGHKPIKFGIKLSIPPFTPFRDSDILIPWEEPRGRPWQSWKNVPVHPLDLQGWQSQVASLKPHITILADHAIPTVMEPLHGCLFHRNDNWPGMHRLHNHAQTVAAGTWKSRKAFRRRNAEGARSTPSKASKLWMRRTKPTTRSLPSKSERLKRSFSPSDNTRAGLKCVAVQSNEVRRRAKQQDATFAHWPWDCLPATSKSLCGKWARSSSLKRFRSWNSSSSGHSDSPNKSSEASCPASQLSLRDGEYARDVWYMTCMFAIANHTKCRSLWELSKSQTFRAHKLTPAERWAKASDEYEMITVFHAESKVVKPWPAPWSSEDSEDTVEDLPQAGQRRHRPKGMQSRWFRNSYSLPMWEKNRSGTQEPVKIP